jgi:hypothetical protein
MHFMLKTVTHEQLKDSKGRLMPTVVCDWISDGAKEEIAKQKVNDEDKLLALIDALPKATLASLATKMGWRLFNGEPTKMKVARTIKGMKKLVTQTRARKLQPNRRRKGGPQGAKNQGKNRRNRP